MSVTQHPRTSWQPAGDVEAPAKAPPAGLAPTPPQPPRYARRSPWWVELLAIGWLVVFYDRLTALAPLRLSAALSHGSGILSLERSLHLDPELTLNRWLSHHHTLGTILSYYYDNAHFVVTLGLLAWLWWRRPDIYRPLRSSLVLINVVGFVVFWRYPVAPPRLLPGSGFSDIVAASHTFGSWHTGKLAADADQFAAMPSLHLAWATWSSLAIWRMSRRLWWRLVAVLYPVVTAIGVLSTGNHYLADVLAGVLTMVISVAAVEFVGRLWRVRRGTDRRARGALADAAEA